MLDMPWAFGTDLVFTRPFIQVKTTALVKKTRVDRGLFVWLEPFESSLWLATIGWIVLSAVAMVALNKISDGLWSGDQGEGKEAGPSTTWGLTQSLYHSFAMLLGGEDYEWVSWPSRIFRLSMLLFTLIIMATYTGNMTNFFLKAGVQLHGPSSMQELREAKACCLWDHEMPQVKNFVKSVVSGQNGRNMMTDNVKTVEVIAQCDKWLQDGTVDVMLGYEPFIMQYWLENCKTTSLVSSIQFAAMDQGFVLPKSLPNAFERAVNLSQAIAFLQSTQAWDALVSEKLGKGRFCPSEAIGDLDPVSLQSMQGLFLVYFVVLVVGLSAAVCERYLKASTDDEDDDKVALDHTATEGEMLRVLMRKVQLVLNNQEERLVNTPETGDLGGDKEDLSPSSSSKAVSLEEETLFTQCFNRYDLNSSGTIDSFEEFRYLCLNLAFKLGKKTNPNIFDHIIQERGAKIEQQPIDLAAFRDWWSKANI